MHGIKPAIFTMFTQYQALRGNLSPSAWFHVRQPEQHMPFHFRPIAFALCLLAGPALAAPTCQTGNFDSWLEGVRQEAAAKGVSKAAIAAGLEGVAFDQGILNRDRGQKVFRQTFEEFSARMVNPRLARAANMMRKHAGLFQRIEAQ